jgi:ankyrin repeat protein
MPKSDDDKLFEWIMDILANGSCEDFEVLAQEVEGFPDGVDASVGRRWITNAIDCGSKQAVQWMIGQDVNLDFEDEEGYPILHSVLDSRGKDRYEILRMLLTAGAPVNARGLNDWTPAHMAAVREDIEALKILVEHNADLTIRTRIDDYATPLEEAWMMGRDKSVQFLKELTPR